LKAKADGANPAQKKQRLVEESIRQQLDIQGQEVEEDYEHDTLHDSLEPIDLSKLSVMARKFPKDYTKKLELLLVQRDQGY
jgi:hypothetical protein